MSDSTLRLVMKYLKQNNYCESLITLERESESNLSSYGKQIDFFRKILIRGDFTESAKFISTFEPRLDERDFKKIMLQLYKQKLYELIENPDQNELKTLFQKEIPNYCTEDDYQNYFTYLTCRTVHDIPGLTGWTIVKGRLQCFQSILPYLDGLVPSSPQREQPQPSLDEIVRNYFKSSFTGVQSNSSALNNNGKVQANNYTKPIEQQHMASSHQKSRVHRVSKEQFSQNKGSPDIAIKNSSRISNSARSSRKVQTAGHSSHPSHQVQLQLSQSKIEKSQIPHHVQKPLEKSHGTFEKRPRMYANLAVNKSMKGDLSRETENDLKSSFQHQTKSEAFRVNPYESSQIEQISQEEQRSQRSDVMKESSISYKFKKPKESPRDQTLEEEVKKNIAYLEQDNSVVYKNDAENENFTFSNNAEFQQKSRKVYKLATITDAKAIRTCQFSQSGRYFALGTNSSYLKIFDVEQLYERNQKCSNIVPVYEIQGLHLKSIFCLDWSVNQRAIVTCSNDLTIRLTQFPEGMGSHRSNVIGKHQGCIRMVKFNSLESKIVSCDDKGLIKIWDIGKVHRCADLKGHKDSGISAFKLSETQGQSILYSVGKDSLIKKWDMRTGDCEATSKKQDSEITYIANNTDRIVVSHKNGTVSFFNSSLHLEHSVQIHEQEIRSIDGNSLDQTFLTASFDGHVSIFSEQTINSPFYHRHNQQEEDKVVFATFCQNPDFNGFASTSTLGICNIYSYD